MLLLQLKLISLNDSNGIINGSNDDSHTSSVILQVISQLYDNAFKWFDKNNDWAYDDKIAILEFPLSKVSEENQKNG